MIRRLAQLWAKVHLNLKWPEEAVAYLDYGPHRIKLGVSSTMEYHTRLHSCKKEPETVSWIEETFQAGDVFYDIGANVGAYTLIAAAHWGRNLRIVAIEPSAINFSRLVRNLILNRCPEQVVPLPVALAKGTKISPFHYQNLDSGGALHALGRPLDHQGAPFQPVGTVPALTFDLDTLIKLFQLPAPHHIKLDVDGTEYDILQGAQQTLRTVRTILVELEQKHPDSAPIRVWLEQFGFKMVSVHPYRFHKDHPEFSGISNAIFQKAESK